MARTQTFKDYVLARESKRSNPYSFTSVLDIRDYTTGYSYIGNYLDDDYSDSNWTYSRLLEDRDMSTRTIVPDEVVNCKVCKALFIPLEDE